MVKRKNIFNQLTYWAFTLFLLKSSIALAKNNRANKRITKAGDIRRPIWNIAHMVNTIDQIDTYLEGGANSIEFDVTFDSEGIAQETFHGVPCDCFRLCEKRQQFEIYLDHLRQLTTPGDPKFQEQIVLLMLDLKLTSLSPSATRRAGKDVAMQLIEHYWKKGKSKARAHILLSIPGTKFSEFLITFRENLVVQGYSKHLKKIGVDFSSNENLDIIKSTFKSLGLKDHIWQGDGISNCLPRNTGRLEEAIKRRDTVSNGSNYIDKVYWWTVDKMSTMRSVLRLDIDAIITNFPDRLVTILEEEEEFSEKFRLATFQDNPWKRFDSPFTPLNRGIKGRSGVFFEEEEARRSDESHLVYNS